MSEDPSDRGKKTRQTIFDALRNLLHERELNRVTVAELARKAQISRSTFYHHFADVEDAFLGHIITQTRQGSGFLRKIDQTKSLRGVLYDVLSRVWSRPNQAAFVRAYNRATARASERAPVAEAIWTAEARISREFGDLFRRRFEKSQLKPEHVATLGEFFYFALAGYYIIHSCTDQPGTPEEKCRSFINALLETLGPEDPI